MEYDLLIRKATDKDIMSMIDLYRQFREWNPPAKFVEGVKELPAFIASHNDNIVGFVTLTSFAPDIVELYNIYVSDKFQSQGLGSKFLEFVEDALKKNSYRGIISVNSDGYIAYGAKRDATKFYEKNKYSCITKTSDTRIFYKSLI